VPAARLVLHRLLQLVIGRLLALYGAGRLRRPAGLVRVVDVFLGVVLLLLGGVVHVCPQRVVGARLLVGITGVSHIRGWGEGFGRCWVDGEDRVMSCACERRR